MANTSTNVPGGSNVDPTMNPQTPNVGTSGLNVGQSTPTIEELQQQLADAQKKLTDFQQSNFDLREKERKRKEQEAADKAALEQRLKEQGEYKTLADQLATSVEDLKAQIAKRDEEIAKRDFETLRARIAQKHGLAPELAARLTGQTEAELDMDAEILKKLVGEQQSQVRNPGNAPGPRPTQTTPETRQAAYEKKLRASGSYLKI